jgi:hypothetical protein
MKKIVMFWFCMIFLIASASAITLPSPNDIYLGVNKTYPIILTPLDNNIWNIDLWILVNGSWNTFNFNWTGSAYRLYLLFNDIGDYPFVINSTQVSGQIAGNFLVREDYSVIFRFYKDKEATIFSSNKYINEMSFVTAELTGDKTFFTNNYDTSLEPFIAQLSDSRYKKPVWFAKYSNGVATLNLFEKGEYAIRLIDGDILFTGEYSVPNVTKSYGTNVYIGKYTFTNSTSYSLLLTDKDLNPFRWLANWIYIILIGIAFIGSVFLFFVIPDRPSLSFMFGIGFISMLTLGRLVIWIWKGF